MLNYVYTSGFLQQHIWKKIEMLYLFTRSACSTTYKDLRLAKCHKPDSSAYIKKKNVHSIKKKRPHVKDFKQTRKHDNWW